ncbi:DUF559 domain-containing protein [Wenzhouxiangella sp. XN79A]|uniref:DUF559 domain-containing protein n=1 Tax=Wenzhouxiangella sp. XN79A TaxID=2724193 RepID=UPI00144AA08B|nr:DUF559 domain-containing protein [Wenzhouxiangella sp. XN79A]NKI35147.1 DUF559 domain-containing protein [Wenzhouxiangella sp. XN79A]
MVTLQTWIAQNSEKLGSRYEELFLRTVLPRVPNLDLHYLQAQMSFEDLDGKRRYCDFAIAETEDLKVAIEIDGYDKTGRGQGMTRNEFLDWQRRQAGLTSQGWHVLRFANIDVRDRPDDCAEHITLLLRKLRARLEHHTKLHKRLIELTQRLEKANKENRKAIQDEVGKYGGALKQKEGAYQKEKTRRSEIEKELSEVRKLLERAEAEKTLGPSEELRLRSLEQTQRIEKLEEEGGIMKTTIWAFAIIIIAVIAAGVVLISGGLERGALQSPALNVQPPISPRVPAGASCESPIRWSEAGSHVGESMSITGPVRSITYRSQSRGQPTWINIGEDFPSSRRLELVIWGRNRASFASLLDQLSVGDVICVTGEVSSYEGRSQIELRYPGQLETG